MEETHRRADNSCLSGELRTQDACGASVAMPAIERQTRSYLRTLFRQQGLNPRHDLGQNFLIDLNIIDYIVRQAEPDARDVVLEVGAGTGSLTAALALHAAAVVSVELDRNLFELASGALAGSPRVTLMSCDVLQKKHQLNPEVLAAVEQALSSDPGRRLKLVANLAYNIATPVISNLVASDLPWERMVVTIQRELGQRMRAAPRTADYGALSVWLQSQCRIEILKKLPPSVFWPLPQVDSAIVRLLPDPSARARIADREFFHDYLRRVFQQRRKHLRGVLWGMFRNKLDKQGTDALLRTTGLPETARAEELDVSVHVDLANTLQHVVHGTGESRGESRPTVSALRS